MITNKLPIKSLTIAAVAALSGCATVHNPDPNDPLESYNRTMNTVNHHVDQALVLPVINMYQDLTPEPARNCIHNMVSNLGDLWSASNSFLQGRPHDFFNSLGRVLFNSTMGLGGCFDVASKNGAERIRNDFGTTLGVWGVGSGPYVVLPVLGPSTVRDSTALVGGFTAGFSQSAPIMSLKNVPVRNSVMGIYFVDLRSGLLDAESLVNDIAIDRYSFIRDAYLQRRQSLLNSKRQHNDDDYDYDNLPDYEDYGDDYDDEYDNDYDD